MTEKVAEPETPDKLGAFPLEYDTSALPERRTAAFARMAIIIATVEAFVIAALGFALAALLPLQKVVPMVVTSNDKGDEIVHINPTSLDSPTVDYVAEIGLRNYVQKRYAIVASLAEQEINWGQGSVVQLMSSPDAYQKFREIASVDVKRLRSASMIRKVRIDSVRKISEDTWQVEFVTTDGPEENVFGMDSGMPSGMPTGMDGQGSSRTWISTFQVGFDARNVTYSSRLNNPFGMIIRTVNDAGRD